MDCTMSKLVIALDGGTGNESAGPAAAENRTDPRRCQRREITLCEEDIKFMTSLAEETAATP